MCIFDKRLCCSLRVYHFVIPMMVSVLIRGDYFVKKFRYKKVNDPGQDGPAYVVSRWQSVYWACLSPAA